MGQIAYRANLSSATFPMTIAEGGRTVIIPGPDQNYDRRVDPTGEQKDAGIPQALYLENVMPTANGYQSVGYIQPTTPMILAAGQSIYSCTEIYVLGSVIVKSVLFQSSAGVLTAGVAGLDTVTVSGTAPLSNDVFSSAVAGGNAYLYSAGNQQLYEVTSGVTITNVTASVTPVNFFTTAGILYIFNFANYLIGVARDRIYWSSLTTPTDFVASLVSGSGSIVPNDLTAAIIRASVTSQGFYLHSANETIFGAYTGNARYPFKFTPVAGFKGLLNYYRQFQVAWGDFNSSFCVAVQQDRAIRILEKNQASDVSTELSNYLAREGTTDVFNYSTNTFSLEQQYTKVPAVYVYNSRYLIVSINDEAGSFISQYTHAIVVDVEQRRVGKLKVPHKFVFSLNYNFDPGDPVGKTVLAFVDSATGTVKYVSLDIYGTEVPDSATYEEAAGALLLGKFQYVRSRMMQLEEIEIEGPQNTAIITSPNFSVALLPSQDGRNFDTPIPLSPTSVSGGLATYHTHNTARNHSLLIKGAFSVNTLQLKFVPGGER